MDVGLLAQYVMNGLMLGMMYTLVAIGFTLFFGVLDIIKFSHGDVLTVGAFTALGTYIGLGSAGVGSTPLLLLAMLVVAILAMAALGMLIARYLVMPRIVAATCCASTPRQRSRSSAWMLRHHDSSQSDFTRSLACRRDRPLRRIGLRPSAPDRAARR